jgi:hypothetical protein
MTTAAEEDAKASEMITRYISWMHVYARELNALEQPGMPMEKHAAIMTLRDEAPSFFRLVSNLLTDALIIGLDSLLDKAKPTVQLTIEHIVGKLTNSDIQKRCKDQLVALRGKPGVRELSIARNNLVAHPNREHILGRDEMALEKDFPNLTIEGLEDMLHEVTIIASLALGKPHRDFYVQDWEGVDQLFRQLRALKDGGTQASARHGG